MRTVSVTEIKTYLRCREEHRIAHVLGIRPARPSDIKLRVGLTVDAGVGAWWRTCSLRAALDAVRAEAAAQSLDVYETIRCEVMLTGYDARWAEEQRAIETLSVQERFTLQRHRPEPWGLAGKIDASGARAGRRFVVETKTTSEDLAPGSFYFARLVIDSQVSLYAVAARELGLEPDVCVYDVLRKPQGEPRLATPPEKRRITKAGKLDARQRDHDETPEEFRARLVEEVATSPESFYARVEVVRLEHELRAAVAEFDEIGLEVVQAYEREEGAAPRSTDACRRFGRLCDYFGVCTGGESLDSERFVQIGRR